MESNLTNVAISLIQDAINQGKVEEFNLQKSGHLTTRPFGRITSVVRKIEVLGATTREVVFETDHGNDIHNEPVYHIRKSTVITFAIGKVINKIKELWLPRSSMTQSELAMLPEGY